MEEVDMYANNQWRVTEHGLETLEGERREYFITPANLVAIRNDGDGPVYEFLVDMGVKSWIDPDAFEASYGEALKIHANRLPRPIDAEIFSRSINAFRAAVRRTRHP